MCRRATCPRCGRATFAGCGSHAEQVLGNVPPGERCRCGRDARNGNEGRAASGPRSASSIRPGKS